MRAAPPVFLCAIALAVMLPRPDAAASGPASTSSARNDRDGGSVALDRVVAVVDNDVVLMSELQRVTDRHPLLQESLSQLPANASADVQAQKRHDVEAKVLDELIDISLLRHEAEKFEIKITEEDVDRAMEDVAGQYGMSVEELRKQVEDTDQYDSWAEYRDELRDQILQLKVPHYLTSWSVSEAQVREHYRKLTKDESAKVRVVQFRFTPKSQDNADRDRAFARAQAIARRLREGEDASALAQSIEGDEAEERAIGRGGIAPTLEDALFAAKQDDVVGPVASSGKGYLVFAVLERVDAAALAYDKVKDRIRQQLENEAFFKAEADLRRQLRAKAHIDIRL